MLDYVSDAELISMLERRGYVVRRRSEANHVLSWNRTEPIPHGIDFKAEAVEKLRAQITPDMVRFETRHGSSVEPLVSPTIQSAYLRVL